MHGASLRLRAFAICALSLALAATTPHALAIEGSVESVTTTIAVKLDDRLSSQENKPGDVFTFELTGSVIVDGAPVGAGVRGHGVVVDVRSGEGRRHGFLTLAARSLDLSDGRHIPVGLAPGSLDRRLTRESHAPVYASSSLDNNVVYEKGTRFMVVAPPPPTPEPGETP